MDRHDELLREINFLEASLRHERKMSKELEDAYEARLATQGEQHARDIALLESMNEKLMAEIRRLSSGAAPAACVDLLTGSPEPPAREPDGAPEPPAHAEEHCKAGSFSAVSSSRSAAQAQTAQLAVSGSPRGQRGGNAPTQSSRTVARTLLKRAEAASASQRGCGGRLSLGGQPRLPGVIPEVGVLGGGQPQHSDLSATRGTAVPSGSATAGDVPAAAEKAETSGGKQATGAGGPSAVVHCVDCGQAPDAVVLADLAEALPTLKDGDDEEDKESTSAESTEAVAGDGPH